MGYFELDNGKITARIASFRGRASVTEGCRKRQGIYVERRSGILEESVSGAFPLVGNYKNKKTSFGGQEYVMSQHGFARIGSLRGYPVRIRKSGWRWIRMRRQGKVIPLISGWSWGIV